MSTVNDLKISSNKQNIRDGFLWRTLEYLEHHRYIYWILLAAVGFIYIFLSDGFYVIDDRAQFVLNREFFIDPSLGNKVWGRLGRVLLYAPFAWIGIYAAKIAAFCIFLGTIYFAVRIAEILKFTFPAFLIILIGFQPEYFDISYSVLAEIPAIFLLTLSLYLYLKDRFTASMITASFIFIFRFEFSIYIALLFLLLLKEKQYKPLIFSACGFLFWWFYAYIFSGNFFALYDGFIDYGKLGKYLPGTEWYHYLVLSPEIFGNAVTLLFLAGAVFFYKKVNKKTALFIFGVIFLSYVVFSLTSSKYFSLSGSVGDKRYLAQIGVLFGLISLAGIEFLFRFHKDAAALHTNKAVRFFRKAIPFLILLAFSSQFFQFFTGLTPHTFRKSDRSIMLLAQKARTLNPNGILYTNSSLAKYTLNYPVENREFIREYTWETLEAADSGFVLWDHYSCGVHMYSRCNIDVKVLMNHPKFRLVDYDRSGSFMSCLFEIQPIKKKNAKLP